MTAAETLRAATAAGEAFQRPLNAFIDEFRRASGARRESLVRDPIDGCGPLQGLVAATVSALCREVGLAAPEWVGRVRSDEPFFAFPARGFALRVRLMIESPPAFRARNVFVPENFMSRA
ncbi:MAG: hypothetical protein ACRENE_23320 [Polyangiaceae bacterium]